METKKTKKKLKKRRTDADRLFGAACRLNHYFWPISKPGSCLAQAGCRVWRSWWMLTMETDARWNAGNVGRKWERQGKCLMRSCLFPLFGTSALSSDCTNQYSYVYVYSVQSLFPLHDATRLAQSINLRGPVVPVRQSLFLAANNPSCPLARAPTGRERPKERPFPILRSYQKEIKRGA